MDKKKYRNLIMIQNKLIKLFFQQKYILAYFTELKLRLEYFYFSYTVVLFPHSIIVIGRDLFS